MSVVIKSCRSCGQGFDIQNKPVGGRLSSRSCKVEHTGPFDPVVQQNSQFGVISAIRTGFEELSRRCASVELNSAEGMRISRSNADHGTAILESLKMGNRVRIIDSSEGDTAIPVEVITHVTELAGEVHESVLINAFTPYLMAVIKEVNSDLRLVNTEYYAWIQSMSGNSKYNMKPDLFSAYYPLINYRSSYTNAPPCTADRLFGTFASWESRASLHCVWDGKWDLRPEGFGEKCKYLQIMGERVQDHNGQALRLKGVFFDCKEFWMVESVGSNIVEVAKCPWSQSGSKKCLIDFLSKFDPWMEATKALCQLFGVHVVDFSAIGEGSAFLGCGANGRVFRLDGGKVIKVVIGENSSFVEREYNNMMKCRDSLANDFVFPIVEGSFRTGRTYDVDFAGYMLDCVGTPIVLPIRSEIKWKIAEALHALHTNDIIHGDPRIQNALLLKNAVKWIDFRIVDFVTSGIDRKRDVVILLKSLGRKESEVSHLIEEYVYAESPSVEQLHAILSFAG